MAEGTDVSGRSRPAGQGVERLEITGRVQGVGFRYWTAQTARELGVRGTVRNRPDGAVEILAAADAATLDLFRTRLREGPPHARVEDVRPLENTKPAEDIPAGFEIVR